MTANSTGSDAEHQLRNLADNLPGGMVYQMIATPTDRGFLFVSRGVEEIFGISPSAALADATSLYDRILPEYIQSLVSAEQQALAKETPFLIEVSVRGPADGVKWVRINSALRIRSDGVQVWDGIVLDITERKQAELDQAASKQRLDLATAAGGIGLWDWDLKTGLMEYSAKAKEIYGFPANQDVSFEVLRALTVPEDFANTGPALKRALDPLLRSNEVYEYRIRRWDTGAVRWVLAHGRATFAEVDGVVQAVSYVGTIQDVTARRDAEEALRAGEERLRLAIGAGRMAVWELDIASGEFTPSSELNQLYGFAIDANPTAEDFRNRYAPGEQERIAREGAEAVASGAVEIQVEMKCIWPDGTVKWLAIRAQLKRDETGIPVRAIGIVMDITERRQAEEHVKLVARELQHRVKNSLAIIQTIAGQTFRGRSDYNEVLPKFTGRLQALAAATDILTETDWSHATLADVIEKVTRPYRNAEDDAFSLNGPAVSLTSNVALALALGLHELGTNALRHGALSVPEGKVALSWSVEDGYLRMTWAERSGPPVLASPTPGFGTRLLQRGLLEGPAGQVELAFEPSGLVCRFYARLAE